VKDLAVLCVADPFYPSGGGMRAFRSLIGYLNRGLRVLLVQPCSTWGRATEEHVKREWNDLTQRGIHIAGSSRLRSPFRLDGTPVWSKISHLAKITVPSLFLKKELFTQDQPDIVVSLHENFDSLYKATELAKFYEIPSVALLQLPTHYENAKRRSNIMRAYELWYSMTLDKKLQKSSRMFFKKFGFGLVESRQRELLKNFNSIIAVSRAIPIDMGEKWIPRVKSLDPGVSLDPYDVSLINNLNSKVHVREDYIIFGGRPIPEKGIVEGLLAFKNILRHHKKMKLVIHGFLEESSVMNINRICKKLELTYKVRITGYIPRDELFRSYAKARLMIYPSHMDSFSYTVLEALCLGLPVVAYRIPALELYYNDIEGIYLVDELDLESFSNKAIELLEKESNPVGMPKIRNWDDIIDEEVSLVEKTLEY